VEEFAIKNLMTTRVKCAAPSTPLSEIVRSMKDNRYSCIVITEQNRPVGIVTERDIVKIFAEHFEGGKDLARDTSSVMSAPPVTIAEDTQLLDALVVAKSNQIRHLPITDASGQLVGLVTQTDLAAAHVRMLEAQAEILDRAVANRTLELVDANEKLRELSLEDPLLKIGNRRAMEVDLGYTHAAALRHGRAYSVVLFDVDHFKLFNDHYGHLAGDQALVAISQFLKQSARKQDRVYRYGGEELLVLLPETAPNGAVAMARRMIHGLAQKKLTHEKHPLKIVTMSGGVSGVDPARGAETWQDVVQRADSALYKAKHQGRNRAESS
jgi:diguanylate cyclase (GGDEF)-like protein